MLDVVDDNFGGGECMRPLVFLPSLRCWRVSSVLISMGWAT